MNSIPRVIAIQPAQTLHFRRRYEFSRNPVLRVLYRMEYKRLTGYEADLARKFDSCLLISEKDRDAIDPKHTLNNIFYNPHGTDVHSFCAARWLVRERGSLVFCGAMYMDTNSDAVLYFHREILPLIWKVRPHTRFTIVGKNRRKHSGACARSADYSHRLCRRCSPICGMLGGSKLHPDGGWIAE